MTDRDPVDPQSQDAALFSYAQILHLLKIEFSRARRYGYPLTCALLRVDRMENLRDLYGDRARETIERTFVEVIHRLSRSSDFLGRMGERYILLLPHTDAEGVARLLDRLRRHLQDVEFDIDGRPVRVTFSAGVSTYRDRNALFFDSILKNAEAALDEVVRRGGNDVAIRLPEAQRT